MKRISTTLITLAMLLFCAGFAGCSSDTDNDYENLQEYYQKVLNEGEEFLKQNGQRPGVITTRSGLQYEVIKEGQGEHPSASSRVKCNYTGTLINGKVFDSTKGKQPLTFALNQVIPGWTEGLQLMPPGSVYKFYIPYTLGYGRMGAGPIPPFSALIFEVELLEIL